MCCLTVHSDGSGTVREEGGRTEQTSGHCGRIHQVSCVLCMVLLLLSRCMILCMALMSRAWLGRRGGRIMNTPLGTDGGVGHDSVSFLQEEGGLGGGVGITFCRCQHFFFSDHHCDRQLTLILHLREDILKILFNVMFSLVK